MDLSRLQKLSGIELTEEKLPGGAQKIYANLMSKLGQGVTNLDFHHKEAIKAAVGDAYSEGYKDGYNSAPTRR